MITPRCKDVFEAVANNDIEGLKYFVEKQNVSLTKQKNDDEETTAHIATKIGNLSLLKYILDKDGTLAASRDLNGNTVLDLAAENGLLSMVEYLLDECKVDIHRTNNLRLGNTVLHIAAQAGQLEVLKYLIEKKKLDPDTRNDVQQPPVFLAASNKHLNVVKYLVEECKIDPTITDHNDNNILFMSAPSGDLTVPRYLLDDRKINLDVNWRDLTGETILQRAARFGQLEFIKYLVEQKHVNLNERDLHGRSALHEAATKANVHVIKYLVKSGANVEIKDLYGQTPLRVALDQDVIECLNGTLRTRRSLTDAFTIPRPGRTVTPILGTNNLEIDRFRMMGSGSVEFHGFLVLARACIRGIKERERAHLISLRETPLEGVDPVALDALTTSSSAFE